MTKDNVMAVVQEVNQTITGTMNMMIRLKRNISNVTIKQAYYNKNIQCYYFKEYCYIEGFYYLKKQHQ